MDPLDDLRDLRRDGGDARADLVDAVLGRSGPGTGRPNGLAVAQFWMISVKPMSLPEICSVTTLVAADSALNCGGLVPALVDCEPVMFVVFAPLQETSLNEAPAGTARWT